jgi:hypothetical protein
MRLKLFYLLAVICCSAFSIGNGNPTSKVALVHSKIKPNDVKVWTLSAQNWKEIDKFVCDTVDLRKTLVFVDVDNVLTYTGEPCTYPYNVETHRDTLTGVSRHRLDEAWGKVFLKFKQEVLDHDAKTVICTFQNNGARLVALTSLVVGKHNEIIKRRDTDMQKKFGIKPIIKGFYTNDAGVFCGSCISTNGSVSSKGKAVCRFVDSLSDRPKYIVFIDDSKCNVDSVIKEVQGSAVCDELVVIHYIGHAQQIPHTIVSEKCFVKFWRRFLKT